MLFINLTDMHHNSQITFGGAYFYEKTEKSI